MDGVARLPAKQRQELFSETAARRSMSPAVVEKDFWVCWTLDKLFQSPSHREHLVFKGGTSLSKVFGLIERFSEDIDLVLDWRLLGYGEGSEDPMVARPSKTKQAAFNNEVNAAAAIYLGETFVPQLRDVFGSCPEVGVSIAYGNEQAVVVTYPAAFPDPSAYLRPQILLEIGPLAAWVPKVRRAITPYAAETFPRIFDTPTCEVEVIAAERTFWEKATILHAEAHRVGEPPPRYSRHFYDLFKLAGSEIRDRALADLDLLEAVVEFKNQFYYAARARYDLAHPGTFRLVPDAAQRAKYLADYRKMRDMIFGDVPAFEDIVDVLSSLEGAINALA